MGLTGGERVVDMFSTLVAADARHCVTVARSHLTAPLRLHLGRTART